MAALLQAAASQGFIEALFTDSGQIYHDRFEIATGAWAGSFSLGVGTEGSLAVTSSGDVLVAFTEGDDITYRERVSGTWKSPVTITSLNGGSCYLPSVLPDRQVFYTDTRGDLAGTTQIPDIMLATISEAGGVSTVLKHSGRYDSSWKQGTYFEKGAIGTAGSDTYRFYQHRTYDHSWGIYHGRWLSLANSSGSGVTVAGITTNSNVFDLYDLKERDGSLYVLYRHGTLINLKRFATAPITLESDVASLTSPGGHPTVDRGFSFEIVAGAYIIGCITAAGELLIYRDATEEVYAERLVDGRGVGIVVDGSNPYAVYGDVTSGTLEVVSLGDEELPPPPATPMISDVGPITNDSPSDASPIVTGIGPITNDISSEPSPTLVGIGPLANDAPSDRSPVVVGIGPLTQSNRSYKTYEVSFDIPNPPPSIGVGGVTIDAGWGLDIPETSPFLRYIIPSAISREDNPWVEATAFLKFIASDTSWLYEPSEKTYVYYDVEFNILEGLYKYYDVEFNVATRKRIVYDVMFNIAQAVKYPVEFNIRDVVKQRTSYEASFNIMNPGEVLKQFYDVEFNITAGRNYYPVTFNVVEPPTSYEVEFNIASGGQSVYSADVQFDIIERWVPVTLPVTVSPSFPGEIPPDANPHRLNVQVYTTTGLLIGAGYAAFIWNGPRPMKLHIIVRDIPELASPVRVRVVRQNRLVIDETVPYNSVWEGWYYGT